MNIFRSIIIILFSLQALFAQQRVVSGKIEKRDTWNGTIIVEGDVTVDNDARLTIEAGTRVLFKPLSDKLNGGKDKTRSELIVYGILIVKGQIENKVIFSSAAKEPRMGDWYGIELLNPQNISIIDYSIIEYGYDGLSIKKNNPLIRNSQIRLNYNSGINVEVKADPKIIKNIISENGYAGVIASLGSKPILTNNLITRNQIGVVAFSLSQPNLGNLGNDDSPNSGENSIFENEKYDLYNHTNLPIFAENNSWGASSNGNLNDRIFDYNDEARYGQVDYQPILGQVNLTELRQLAQESTNAAAKQINTVRDSVKNKTAAAKDTSAVVKDKTAIALNTPLKENKPFAAISQTDKEKHTTVDERITNLLENNEPPKAESPNTPRINYNQIFLEYFLDDQKARIIKQVAPQITNPSLGLGAKGRIIVRAIVDKEGKVESAAVIKGLNTYYDSLALKAALKFRYKIGTIEGKPVRFYTNILFEF